MKIGIMGGTFDPIHYGHLMLGEYAYKQFELDEVWFMPNGNPPHKQNATNRTDAKHRGEMVKLAIAGNDAFKLQEYEIHRTEISYSYQTMETFNNMYPDDEFYFIIGGDSLFAFETWVHPERIVKTCTILATYRDEYDNIEVMEKRIQELNEKFDADIRLMITPLIHVSSSGLREALKNGQSISDFVPEAVEDYIRENNLYQIM